MAPEHKPYLHRIETHIKEWGLDFQYRGALDPTEKIAYLESLDVLSTPTVYSDPKGIFVLEAMANEVPVVQPRHGAFPEIIAKTGGGILVEPNSVDSLAEEFSRSGVTSRVPMSSAAAAPRACGNTMEWRLWRSAPWRRTVSYSGRQSRRIRCSKFARYSKSYSTPRGPLEILSDVSLSLSRGDACRHHGTFWHGEEHASLHLGCARAADVGHDNARWAQSLRAAGAGAGGLSQ